MIESILGKRGNPLPRVRARGGARMGTMAPTYNRLRVHIHPHEFESRPPRRLGELS